VILWIVITILAPILVYLISFGPACWWVAGSDNRVSIIYWPIGRVAAASYVADHHRGTIFRIAQWYATLTGRGLIVPCDSKGDRLLLLNPQ
jgi:hypothetical protein